MAIGLAALTANAGPGVFNHLGFGAGIGTSGITIEAATPITNFVNLRAGVSWMPAITFNADADFTYTVMSETQTGTVNLKGDLGRVQGQVIFNVSSTQSPCIRCRRRLFRRRQTAQDHRTQRRPCQSRRAGSDRRLQDSCRQRRKHLRRFQGEEFPPVSRHRMGTHDSGQDCEFLNRTRRAV